MMNKVGILVFYVNIGNIAPEEVDGYIESVQDAVKPKDRMNEADPINLWDLLFIPVRETETYIQVVRNDGKSGMDEILLSELKEKLNETKDNL